MPMLPVLKQTHLCVVALLEPPRTFLSYVASRTVPMVLQIEV